MEHLRDAADWVCPRCRASSPDNVPMSVLARVGIRREFVIRCLTSILDQAHGEIGIQAFGECWVLSIVCNNRTHEPGGT